jgi:predicted AAA+ superfamily ATPase
VGKVNLLELKPMCFEEFLLALGEERLVNPLRQQQFDLLYILKEAYTEKLKQYYFTGGMPAVVDTFRETGDYGNVRRTQKEILAAYQADFSKHVPPPVVPRIRLLWQSLPAQLARENKKFMYGIIKEGARAKDYEVAMLWLEDCGLAYRVHRVSVPRLPLPAYRDLHAFKFYVVDIGLLGAMSELRSQTLLEGNALFTEFKGALTEQFVLQELKTLPKFQTYYWSPDSGKAEIDFLLGSGELDLPGGAVPVEVKAEVNLQAKSLKTYREYYNPPLSLRISLSDYKEKNGLADIPLYAFRAYLESEFSKKQSFC